MPILYPVAAEPLTPPHAGDEAACRLLLAAATASWKDNPVNAGTTDQQAGAA
jgi:hypothetical protein